MNKIIIVDNFLDVKDPLYQEVQDKKNWENLVEYSWMCKNQPVETVWHKMIKRIWETFNSEDLLPEGFEGWEYWTNRLDHSWTDTPWHRDKDEFTTQFIGLQNVTWMGSIYYVNPDLEEGGELQIKCQDNAQSTQNILALNNRLVIMDSGENFHRVLKGKGQRKSFVTNVWIDKPPSQLFDNTQFNPRENILPQGEY